MIILLIVLITILIFVIRALILTSKATGAGAGFLAKIRENQLKEKGKNIRSSIVRGTRSIGHAINVTARTGARLLILCLKIIRGVLIFILPHIILIDIIVLLIFIAGAAGAYIFIFRTDYYVSTGQSLANDASASGSHIETNAVDLDALDWDSITDAGTKDLLRRIAEQWPENMTQERAKAIIKGASRVGVSTYSQEPADGRGGDSDDQKVFDCSSFVSWSLNKGGGLTNVPCDSNTAAYFTPTLKCEATDNIGDILPADVALWKKTAELGSKNHALMYIGDYEGHHMYLHCTSHAGDDDSSGVCNTDAANGKYALPPNNNTPVKDGARISYDYPVATYRKMVEFPEYYKREVGGDSGGSVGGNFSTGGGLTNLGVGTFSSILEYVKYCLEQVYGKEVNYSKISNKENDGKWIRPKSWHGKMRNGGSADGLWGSKVSYKKGEEVIVIETGKAGKNKTNSGIAFCSNGAVYFPNVHNNVSDSYFSVNLAQDYTEEMIESFANSLKLCKKLETWTSKNPQNQGKPCMLMICNFYTFRAWFLESETGDVGSWKIIKGKNGKKLYSRFRSCKSGYGWNFGGAHHPSVQSVGGHGKTFNPENKKPFVVKNAAFFGLKSGTKYYGTGANNQALGHPRAWTYSKDSTKEGTWHHTNSIHSGCPNLDRKSIESKSEKALTSTSYLASSGGCTPFIDGAEDKEGGNNSKVGIVWIWEWVPTCATNLHF